MVKKPRDLTKRVWISMLLLLSLFFVAVLIAALFGSSDEIGANVAHIKIVGPIVGDNGGGLLSSDAASSSDITTLLREARDDSAIKAVLLEINTPGGSAVASDEIGQAIKDVRASGKPVVAWIRESGASGGYWIASSTDHIVANRMSITGSIGVYGSYLGFSDFLDDWNVTHYRLVSGDRKDVGDPFEPLNPRDRAYLQGKLDRVHEFFIEEVARNRNMSVEDVRPLADGSFMLGVEAKDVGLVDELGGRDEALAWIGDRIGEEPVLEDFTIDEGILAQLFGTDSHAGNPLLATQWVPFLR